MVSNRNLPASCKIQVVQRKGHFKNQDESLDYSGVYPDLSTSYLMAEHPVAVGKHLHFWVAPGAVGTRWPAFVVFVLPVSRRLDLGSVQA